MAHWSRIIPYVVVHDSVKSDVYHVLSAVLDILANRGLGQLRARGAGQRRGVSTQRVAVTEKVEFFMRDLSVSAQRKTVTCESSLTTRTLLDKDAVTAVAASLTAPLPRASPDAAEHARRVVYNRIPSRPTFLRKARPRFSLLDTASTRHFSSRPRVPCGVTRRTSITDVAETLNGVVGKVLCNVCCFLPTSGGTARTRRRENHFSLMCFTARVTNFSKEVSFSRIYRTKSKVDTGSKESKSTIRHACRRSK